VKLFKSSLGRKRRGGRVKGEMLMRGNFRGFGKGEVEGMAAGAFGGGAIGFLALAAVGWRVGGLGALGKVAGKL
jgi:hypothetical protein